MTPEQLALALEALGLSPEAAHRRFPEIHEGANAQAKDYHLVHRADGRISVEGPDDRSNSTTVEYLDGEPAIFTTADEARLAIYELTKRTIEIYGPPKTVD